MIPSPDTAGPSDVYDVFREDTRLEVAVGGGMVLGCLPKVTVGAAEYEDFLAAAKGIARAVANAGHPG
jgi:hypothetical protein